MNIKHICRPLLVSLGLLAAAGSVAIDAVPAHAASARTVSVFYYKVHMTDDSDSFGSGEITYHYSVNRDSTKLKHSGVWSHSSGGNYYNFLDPITFQTSASSVELDVMAADDDQDPGDLCSAALGNTPVPSAWNQGSNTCADWNTAKGVFSLPAGSGSQWVWITSPSGAIQFSVLAQIWWSA